MDDVFSGKLKCMWMNLRTRPDRYFPPLKRLMTIRGLKFTKMVHTRTAQRWWKYRKYNGQPKVIKFIRANLLAEWLVDSYGFKGAVVVRHPAAVLDSVKRRQSAEWSLPAMQDLLNRYLIQPDLVQDRLDGKVDALRNLTTLAQVHTAIWCIENAQFLPEYGRSAIPVVFYEDLVTQPDDSWPLLMQQLGLDSVPDDDLLNRPSQQASFKFAKRATVLRLISFWEERLSDEQKRDVDDVLRLFGVTTYRSDSPLPDRDGPTRHPEAASASLSRA